MDVLERLKKVKDRFEIINQQLSDPAFMNDREKIISLSRERSDLAEIMEAYEEYSGIIKNIEGNKEIIDSKIDKDLITLAEAELDELEEKKESLE
jgi:peptide chain release factor 1